MTDESLRRSWESGGPEAVAPGVHRLPLPLPNDGLRAVNVYCLQAEGGLVLIDSGWAIAESEAALARGMAVLDLDLGDVQQIFVTHVHSDHYTQAVALRRRFGVEIALGAGERQTLETVIRDRVDRPALAISRLARLGAPELADRLQASDAWHPFDADSWELPDRWLEPGYLDLGDRNLKVVPTPGHTQGHVVFADGANGLLFAGDHVLPRITPSIGLEEVDSLVLGDYLQSLERMLEMADSRLLPAHGPVETTTHTRVAELIAHHDQRLALCVDATLRLEEATAHDIAGQLPWTRRLRPFASLDDFNRLLAVNETAAHLDLLVSRGALAQNEVDGVLIYQAAMAAGGRP